MVILELLMSIGFACILRLFLLGFLPQREERGWRRFCLFAALILGMTALSCLSAPPLIRFLFCAGAVMALTLTVFHVKPLPAVFSGLTTGAVLSLSELIILAVFSASGIDRTQLGERADLRLLGDACELTAALCLMALLPAFVRKRRLAVTAPLMLWLLPAELASVFLGGELARGLSNDPERSRLYLLAAVTLGYLSILSVLFAEHVRRNGEREAERAMLETRCSAQERYYSLLRQEQQETRALSHDIRKYLSAMHTLAAEAKSEEADRVLSDAQTLFDRLGSVTDVGNPIVSAVLTDFRRQAEAAHIAFRYDVSVPETLTVSAGDLYILMGNSLDNALAACKRLSEGREIRLQLRRVNDILFYRVENPLPEKQPERKPEYGHGYGLRNIRRCVEKYDGDCMISTENGSFVLSARLNLPPANPAEPV